MLPGTLPCYKHMLSLQKKQSVLPVAKDQLCFIRFISPNMLTLESVAHTSHFPMLLNLLVFFKE